MQVQLLRIVPFVITCKRLQTHYTSSTLQAFLFYGSKNSVKFPLKQNHI